MLSLMQLCVQAKKNPDVLLPQVTGQLARFWMGWDRIGQER